MKAVRVKMPKVMQVGNMPDTSIQREWDAVKKVTRKPIHGFKLLSGKWKIPQVEQGIAEKRKSKICQQKTGTSSLFFFQLQTGPFLSALFIHAF